MTEKTLFCPNCGTKAEIAAGIGPYCPNNGCPVADNFNNWDKPKEPIKSAHTVIDELRKENDALKAHVERLREHVKLCMESHGNSLIVPPAWSANILKETPQQSLSATRNETLEKAAAVCRKGKPWGNNADDWAAECLEEAACKIEAMKEDHNG